MTAPHDITPHDATPDAALILRQRAKALAQAGTDRDESVECLDILEFQLAQERYAIEAEAVHGVQPLRELTPLPGTPDFLAGVVSVHGQLVAVIDIKRFFDLPPQGVTDLHSIILLRSDDLRIGLLADTVIGVHTVEKGALQAALFSASGIREEFLKGVTADCLAVIDAAAVLADPRLTINEDVV